MVLMFSYEDDEEFHQEDAESEDDLRLAPLLTIAVIATVLFIALIFYP